MTKNKNTLLFDDFFVVVVEITTRELIRSIETVGVIITLLFLGDALVVPTAKLGRGADGWNREGQIDIQFITH